MKNLWWVTVTAGPSFINSGVRESRSRIHGNTANALVRKWKRQYPEKLGYSVVKFKEEEWE